MKHNLIGKTFSRLTVVSLADHKGVKRRWLCRCQCGNMSVAHTFDLVNHKHRSCGCLQRQIVTKHGLTPRNGIKPSEYHSWLTMKQRCTNRNEINYHRYGGRGIKVCKRWLHSFPNFLNDMGRKPTIHHTIERINNNGHYKPSNCKWATRQEQSLNKYTNRLISYYGKTLPLTAWAYKYGQDVEQLRTRIKLGWPLGTALHTPTLKKRVRLSSGRYAPHLRRGRYVGI